MKLTEFIYDSIKSKQYPLTSFVDYRKAFDTLSHSKLLRKLELYGIPGVALELIRSYFSNKFQKVKIIHSFSEQKQITVGAPQGSILEPLLLILYINDFSNVLPNFIPILFAVDTALSFKNSDVPIILTIFHHELASFHKWSLARKTLPDVQLDIQIANNTKSLEGLGKFLGSL